MLLELQLRQLGAQHLHGVVTVLELAALRLAEHHDARGQVGQADGGGGLVDVLAAGAAGAAGLHLDVLRPDLDLAVVVQLGHDLHGGEAGLPPGVGVEGRYTDQSVHAVLALEITVGVVALDEDGGGLDACLVACLVVHQLIGVAVALSPAGVHAVEHLGPVLGLGAACTGVEGENGVIGVVFTGQQRCQTPLADFLFQVLVPAGDFRQQGGVVLLLGHFAQGHGVLPLGHQPVILLDAVLQTLDLLGHLLAVLDVVPEALLLRLGLEILQLLAILGDAQGLLQLPQSGLQGLELLFVLVVFNDCHRWSSPYRKNSLAYPL